VASLRGGNPAVYQRERRKTRRAVYAGEMGGHPESEAGGDAFAGRGYPSRQGQVGRAVRWGDLVLNVFELFAKIGLDTSEYDKGLDEAKGKATSFSDRLKNVGGKISSAGKTLTKGVTLPIAGIGTAIIKAGSDYEAGMDKVAAISGATGTEIDALGEKAMEMAAKTKFSTAESAEAYKYMAMAGWGTNDMLNSLSSIMYLAGASGESLGATSDIVTDAMTAFGLAADENSKVLKDGLEVEVSNATRFTDVLAAASNNANTNVSMLGESFKYVAPVAGAMGYSVEDTAIALGLMANSGIKAGSAGAQLRNIISNMAKPTDTMAAAMDTLGVSLDDGEGNMYSLLEVMNQLREGFGGGKVDSQEFADGMNQLQEALDSGKITADEYQYEVEALTTAMYGAEGAQKAELAAALAGKEGMAGLLSIVTASQKDYEKLTEAIYNSNGATENMYNIMTDNANGAVTMLSSAINVLFTNLSKFLIPAFTDIVRKITEAVNWFNSLDDSTKKIILTIAGIAAAVGPALLGIGKLITAVGTISKAIGSITGIIKGVGGAFSGLFSILSANPIGLVIAAIGALIAIFVALWNNCEGFREFWIGLWEGIKDAASKAWEGIKSIFSSAWENTKKTWALAAAFFQIVWNEISEVFSGVVEFFGNIFSTAWENMKTTWAQSAAFFQLVWKGISGAFDKTKEFFGDVFSSAWENTKKTWEQSAMFFQLVWKGISAAFDKAQEFFQNTFSSAWESVKSAWSSAKEFFGDIWSNLQEKAKSAAQGTGEALKNAWSTIQSAWSGTKEFFGGIWNSVKEKGSSAANGLKSAFQSGWNGIKSAWGNATSFFGNIGSKILNSFQKLPSQLANVGGNMIKGLWNGINEKLSWLMEKVSSAVSRIKSKFTGKDGFDEHSPSKWANQVFRYVLEGGGEGLEAGTPSLLRDVDNIVSRVKDSMNADFSDAWALPDVQSAQAAPHAYGAGALSADGGTTINITINGAQYSDERALVERMSQELQFLMDRRKNAFVPA